MVLNPVGQRYFDFSLELDVLLFSLELDVLLFHVVLAAILVMQPNRYSPSLFPTFISLFRSLSFPYFSFFLFYIPSFLFSFSFFSNPLLSSSSFPFFLLFLFFPLFFHFLFLSFLNIFLFFSFTFSFFCLSFFSCFPLSYSLSAWMGFRVPTLSGLVFLQEWDRMAETPPVLLGCKMLDEATL